MTAPVDLGWYRVREFDRGREDAPPMDVCPSCWAIHGARFPEGTERVGRFRVLRRTVMHIIATSNHDCHFCGLVLELCEVCHEPDCDRIKRA